MFYKKCILENFTKLTEKHLSQSLFFNKVAGLKPATLLRKRLWHKWIPVNSCEFLQTKCLFCKEDFLSDFEKELSSLNTKNLKKFKNIPQKILKASVKICSKTLTGLFNNTLLTLNFPTKLKIADVSPFFKKDNSL